MPMLMLLDCVPLLACSDSCCVMPPATCASVDKAFKALLMDIHHCVPIFVIINLIVYYFMIS